MWGPLTRDDALVLWFVIIDFGRGKHVRKLLVRKGQN